MLLLDNTFAWFWGKVLTVLCRATGKSNFYFARFFTLASYVVFTALVVLRLVISQSSNETPYVKGVTVLVVTSLIPMTGIFTYRLLRLIDTIESLMHRFDGAIIASEQLAPQRVLRQASGILLLVWYSPFGPYLFLRAAALYCAFDYHPGQKGRLKRALKKLRQRLAVTGSRTPAPAPA